MALIMHPSLAVHPGDWLKSEDMAIRFEKAFGVKADTLMRMQTAFDLAQARARADEIVVDKVLIAS